MSLKSFIHGNSWRGLDRPERMGGDEVWHGNSRNGMDWNGLDWNGMEGVRCGMAIHGLERIGQDRSGKGEVWYGFKEVIG